MEPKNIFDLDWSRLLEFYDLSKRCFACGAEPVTYRVVPTTTKVKVFGFCSDHASAMPVGFEADEGEVALLQVNLHHKLVMTCDGRKENNGNARFGLSFAPPEPKPELEGADIDPKSVDPAIVQKVPAPWEIDDKTMADPDLATLGTNGLDVVAWSKLGPADFYFDVDNTPDGIIVAVAPKDFFDKHGCLYDQTPYMDQVCNQQPFPDYLYECMEAMFEIDEDLVEAAIGHQNPNQQVTPQVIMQFVQNELSQLGFIHNPKLKNAGGGGGGAPPPYTQQPAPGPNSLLKQDGPFWVPDYSKIQPSDMLFAYDPEEGVYMVAREYFDRENCVHDTDIDYNWVQQHVPSELHQACESLFHFNGNWDPIRQKLLAAGFVEDVRILGEDVSVEAPKGPPPVIDFNTLKPSEMLFGVTLTGNSNYDPNTVLMCPKPCWDYEPGVYEMEIDPSWVSQHVPYTLVQTAEAIFEIRGDWNSIKQQLLAAGFIEEPNLVY